MDESALLYRAVEPDGTDDTRRVVLRLPEGCDTAEGVIMQIEGDKIRIIAQGDEVGEAPLSLAMESIIESASDAVGEDAAPALTGSEQHREQDQQQHGEQADLQPDVDCVEEMEAVELRVRQLYRLEERLEEEERRQEQERAAAAHRQELLERRRRVERSRQQAQEADDERLRRQIERRLSRADRRSPVAADESGAERQRRAAEEPPPPPPPPPPRAGNDPTDEDWTPAKHYADGRRRQARRSWQPPERCARDQQEETTPGDTTDDAAAVAAGAAAAGAGVTEEGEIGDRSVAEETSQFQTMVVTADDSTTAAADEEEQAAAVCRDPDGVQTTTIEFVSLNSPTGHRRDRTALLSGGGVRRRRKPAAVPTFYCRRCDKSFENSSSLVEHITTLHKRPWCRRCRCEFDSAPELAKHRRLCRSQCNLCGLRVANMAQHIRTKHPSHGEDGGQSVRAAAEGAERAAGQGSRRRRQPRRTSPTPDVASDATPTVIEYRDVKTLREQVKHVKTPRISLKYRRSVLENLERIHRLTVTDRTTTSTEEAPAGARNERPHACQRCGEQLGSLQEQIVHLHTVHKGKSWCKRCRTEFPDKRSHLEHRARCRRTNGTCHLCGKDVKNLKMHYRRTHDSDWGRSEALVDVDGKLVSASLAGGQCDICKKHISHRLRRHVASHVRHPCPICKKLFSREDVIAGHIKRVHMKERPHICNHCGKGFVSLYSMQRHEMIHTNSYRFYCQECGDGFRQKQQLTAHMRHKHGVVEIEFEDVRESTFLGTITDGTVTTELRFYCQECGSGFHSRRLLTAHMRIKHGVANVVFEDVQLHVAGPIEHLEAVTVTPEEGVAALTEQATDTADSTAGDPRQSWWDPDQPATY
ncbi:Zinc finger protein 62 [Amphibalanus amphitrite]|uniref:Zinc finger protein 62 n=1 Tax=Amphibalanus amphitrite TaxID=1232801 RepID=A0A6A4WT16_AMPAM|nr:Zinc finger protein 62 [Amphibalanus amphitrite]